MPDQDDAAGNAVEALQETEQLQILNESFKGDIDAGITTVRPMPDALVSVVTALEVTLRPRARSMTEIAEQAGDHVTAADITSRFPETTDALTRLEEAKDACEGADGVLEDAWGYATIALENLRSLDGALAVITSQADAVNVALLDARNHVEDLIRRLS